MASPRPCLGPYPTLHHILPAPPLGRTRGAAFSPRPLVLATTGVVLRQPLLVQSRSSSGSSVASGEETERLSSAVTSIPLALTRKSQLPGLSLACRCLPPRVNYLFSSSRSVISCWSSFFPFSRWLSWCLDVFFHRILLRRPIVLLCVSSPVFPYFIDPYSSIVYYHVVP